MPRQLTSRQRYILSKFRIGFVARCHSGIGSYTATLKPPPGLRANSERVRCETLDALTDLGYLVPSQAINLSGKILRGDLIWKYDPPLPPERVVSVTDRQRYILGKFRLGYYAWAFCTSRKAMISPGKGVVGHIEHCRVETLEALTALGFLDETQSAGLSGSYRGNINWTLSPNPPQIATETKPPVQSPDP